MELKVFFCHWIRHYWLLNDTDNSGKLTLQMFRERIPSHSLGTTYSDASQITCSNRYYSPIKRLQRFPISNQWNDSCLKQNNRGKDKPEEPQRYSRQRKTRGGRLLCLPCFLRKFHSEYRTKNPSYVMTKVYKKKTGEYCPRLRKRLCF